MVVELERDGYHDLLVEYATGALDEACSLIVATHLALSPQARALVQKYETVGGAVLQKCCAPVAMKKDALEHIMMKLDKLEQPKDTKAPEGHCKYYNAMPSCLKKYVGTSCNGITWQNDDVRGYASAPVRTCCSRSRAALWKIEPGRDVAEYSPKTREITLVLHGIYHDERGAHMRGEMFVHEQDTPRRLRGDEAEGCICLVVAKAPPRTGMLGAILNALCK